MFPESSRSAAAPSKTGGLKPKSKMSMRVAAPPTTSKGKGKAQPAQQNDDDDSEDAMSVNDDAISLEEDEPDTEDEIQASKGGPAKSKKTAKRKRRATSPNSFGLALESLLGTAPAAGSESEQEEVEEEEVAEKPKAKKPKAVTTMPAPAQGSTILSLAPHLRRSAQSTALNARASRIAIEQRRAREERARVKDVIGGWGPPGELPTLEGEPRKSKLEEDDEKLGEWVNQGGNQGYERRLRKVAQRGVVKLFNAIRAAQTTSTEDLEAVDSKPSSTTSGKDAKKPVTVLGGKEGKVAELSKSNFLDLIRKGSKATAAAK